MKTENPKAGFFRLSIQLWGLITVAGVVAGAASLLGFFAQLPRYVHRAASPVLLLGDLNVSPWSPYFRRLLRESGLRDSSQGRGVRPTWPTFNPLMLIPIDHCLYSPGIAIVNRQTGPHVGSDHFPVIVDFVIGADGMGEANHAWKNNDFAASPALLQKLVAELKQPRYLHAGDQRLVREYARMDDAAPKPPVEPASPQTRSTGNPASASRVDRAAELAKFEQPRDHLPRSGAGGTEWDACYRSSFTVAAGGGAPKASSHIPRG